MPINYTYDRIRTKKLLILLLKLLEFFIIFSIIS